MTSFCNKSYKRVTKSNFTDSSSDEEEENRRTSVQTKKSLIFNSPTTCVAPTTISSDTSTLPSSSSSSLMRNQSLVHASSRKIKFNKSASDLDINVHSASSSEGHSTTNESRFTSASTSKKPLGCMSKSNDNDREFGNFHVDSKEGTVAIC